MKQCWSTGELAESWTLSDDEKRLSDPRTQQGQLGLAVLLIGITAAVLETTCSRR